MITNKFDLKKKAYAPEKRAHIIIGHVGHNIAKIWLGGNSKYQHAELTVGDATVDKTKGIPKKINIRLTKEEDYCHVEDIADLSASQTYPVKVRFCKNNIFGSKSIEIASDITTSPMPNEINEFEFILGSCNLSVVALNNISSQVGGVIGLGLSGLSMVGVPEGMNRIARLVWRCRILVIFLIQLIVKFLFSTNKLRQQTQFLFRSPFIKLEELYKNMFKNYESRSKTEKVAPPFMLHIGDQIYYDVWLLKRNHKVEYLDSYKEAWHQDRYQKKFLEKCPNYMILDDHELVDNYRGEQRHNNNRKFGFGSL